MLKYIFKALKNPFYAIYLINKKYINFFLKEKFYVYSKEFRTESEDGHYANAILSSLKSQKSFDNFKRNYHYKEILEHVSKDQGEIYLNILQNRNDQILEKGLKTVLIDDSVGNPFKYNYHKYKILMSPTTLRYLKVASDIRGLFGIKFGIVAEIGCGYGGQAYVNDQLLNVEKAKLFDLPFVNNLIDRYLNSYLLRGSYETTVINQFKAQKFDLVISNYAFSELPCLLQKLYIRKVLSNSEKGYLTMNSGIGGKRSKNKLSLNELRDLLPAFEVIQEEPLTSKYNYIIIWGHNEEFTKKNFRILNKF